MPVIGARGETAEVIAVHPICALQCRNTADKPLCRGVRWLTNSFGGGHDGINGGNDVRGDRHTAAGLNPSGDRTNGGLERIPCDGHDVVKCFCLLRASRQRPCRRRAAEHCDELPSPHRIDPGEPDWSAGIYQTSL